MTTAGAQGEVPQRPPRRPAPAAERAALPAALAAGALCLLVHLRSLHGDFVNRDDYVYVLHNTFIRHLDPGLLAAAFTEAHAGFWMPLTWLSFALDYRLWGLDPAGYHLTNALLHAANTVLVVLVAERLLRGARPGESATVGGNRLHAGVLLFAGLLFGIHPLRVESVAWVAERKDVLNGLFALGATLCYLGYAQRRERGEPARRAYLAALALFVLSLLAKSSSTVLPALFLVADWYPLGRLRAGRVRELLVEKAPFLVFAVAAAATAVATVAGSGNLVPYGEFPLSKRLAVSGNALFEYVRLTLYPVGIVPFYAIPRETPPAFLAKSAVVAAAAVGVLLARRRRWIPAVALGFALPLLPVLAIFQNGAQAMAARFTYLAAVAPSVAAAALAGLACAGALEAGRRRLAGGMALLAVALLAGYAVVSARLIDAWENTGTLWTRQIALQPIGRAYRERGIFYQETGRPAEAIVDYTAAIDSARSAGWPGRHNLHAFRALALVDLERHEEALADLDEAISLSPHPSYFQLRGHTLQRLGRLDEAARDFRLAGPEPAPLSWF